MSFKMLRLGAPTGWDAKGNMHLRDAHSVQLGTEHKSGVNDREHSGLPAIGSAACLKIGVGHSPSAKRASRSLYLAFGAFFPLHRQHEELVGVAGELLRI
jgi:hypothetical protein